jgi:TM2 domain-containing membrane protein YozV
MFCPKCGKPCEDGARFCDKCGQGVPMSAPAPGPGRVVDPRGQGARNPSVALLLSIPPLGLLGIGQFYNGDWKKGLVVLLLVLFFGWETLGVVPFAVWIWAMIDAYQVASGKWKRW